MNVVTTLQGKQWDTTFIIKSLNNQKVEVSLPIKLSLYVFKKFLDTTFILLRSAFLFFGLHCFVAIVDDVFQVKEKRKR